MDDRDYRQLEKIVKTEKRAPLGEITAKFNEERIVSVSKTDGKATATFKGSWIFHESVLKEGCGQV